MIAGRIGAGCVGILPIKEESQRVPFKNFAPLGGEPMWIWALRSLAQVPALDYIVVNTDAPDRIRPYLESFDFGKDIVLQVRGDLARGVSTPMNAVLADVLSKYAADVYLQTHATSPFARPESFARALETLARDRSDCVVAVQELRERFWDAAFEPLNHDPAELLQTQDLPPVYVETSTFYAFTLESFHKHGNRIGARRSFVPVSPLEAMDVDTLQDFAAANLVAFGMLAETEAGRKMLAKLTAG